MGINVHAVHEYDFNSIAIQYYCTYIYELDKEENEERVREKKKCKIKE